MQLRLHQVRVHAAQGVQMPAACDEHVFGRGLPADQLQQGLTQRVQPLAGFGREAHAHTGRALAGAQVELVPDIDAGHTRRQLPTDPGVGGHPKGLTHAGEIMQEQDGIRGLDFVPGTGNTDHFHFVRAVAQARGVDHVQGNALDLDGLLHPVPRGASNGRHDGQLGTGQGIEQRGLPHIGFAQQ